MLFERFMYTQTLLADILSEDVWGLIETPFHVSAIPIEPLRGFFSISASKSAITSSNIAAISVNISCAHFFAEDSEVDLQTGCMFKHFQQYLSPPPVILPLQNSFLLFFQQLLYLG